MWSRDGKTIYFSANVLQANEIFSADVATGAVKQFPKSGGSPALPKSVVMERLIVGTTSSVATANRDLQSLTLTSPLRAHQSQSWLTDYALAETEVVKWKSKDGMEIEGLLTKPVGYAEGAKFRCC